MDVKGFFLTFLNRYGQSVFFKKDGTVYQFKSCIFPVKGSSGREQGYTPIGGSCPVAANFYTTGNGGSEHLKIGDILMTPKGGFLVKSYLPMWMGDGLIYYRGTLEAVEEEPEYESF